MNNSKDMKWQVLIAADEARRQGYTHTYRALLDVLEALMDTSDHPPLPATALLGGVRDEVFH